MRMKPCVCGVPSYGRCVSVQKSSKRWKRKHHYFQQRAREERLNKNKKWKGEVPPEGLNLKKMYKGKETRKQDVSVSQTTEDSVDSICLDDNDQLLEGSVIICEAEENSLKADVVSENSLCVENQSASEKDNKECCEIKSSSLSSSGDADYSSSSERKKPNHSSKRCSDKYLDNPKDSKCYKPSTDIANLSQKYSSNSR
ncbi:hypothetical protein Bca4012_025640 [Brassica carinata]